MASLLQRQLKPLRETDETMVNRIYTPFSRPPAEAKQTNAKKAAPTERQGSEKASRTRSRPLDGAEPGIKKILTRKGSVAAAARPKPTEPKSSKPARQPSAKLSSGNQKKASTAVKPSKGSNFEDGYFDEWGGPDEPEPSMPEAAAPSAKGQKSEKQRQPSVMQHPLEVLTKKRIDELQRSIAFADGQLAKGRQVGIEDPVAGPRKAELVKELAKQLGILETFGR